MQATQAPSGPPSLLLRLGELTTAAQLPRLASQLVSLRRQPRGNGEPIMIMPGFGAGDGSTRPLRQYLRSLGYRVSGWGLGINHGNVHKLVPQVLTRVIRRSERFGQKVSLVGWSLGGVIAREVARERPGVAQRVITFGTPVVGGPKYTATAEYYERRGLDLDAFEAEVHARNQIPIEVPITAIYTKRDGVVSWRASVDRFSPHAENIEVTGTHIGLGINPDVWRIVAQRLASTR